MTTDVPSQQPQTVEQALHQAIVQHQAGYLEAAGKLYQAILQIQPNHAEANHSLGILAVQAGLPAAGLPHFMAALDADPTCGRYWLNYIDALFQAGQTNDARQILELAKQHGLEGGEMEALAARLDGKTHAAGLPAAPASGKPATVAPRGAGTSGTKSAKPGKRASSRGKAPSPQEINELVALFNKGRLAEAASRAQAMTERYPTHGASWKTLGSLLSLTGRSVEALTPLQKAVQLLPGDAEIPNSMGIVLQSLGWREEAEASYRRALAINPDFAQAHSNLGATLQDLERPEEAERCYRRALQIAPDYAKAHCNLGALLLSLDRPDEAEACFRQALAIEPKLADAHYNLGCIFLNSVHLEEAESCFRQTLNIQPEHAEAHYNLGRTMQNVGRLEEAETSLRQALKIRLDHAEAYSRLSQILLSLDRLNEAEASSRQALRISPNDAQAHHQLGAVLRTQYRLDEAEACFRQAIQIKPDFAEAYNFLGGTLGPGRMDEAADCFRRALAIKPDYSAAYSGLLMVMQYMPAVTPDQVFEEHRRYAERYEAPLIANWLPHQNSRDPERRLKVGYVSGDFFNHAVAFFIEPILASHDKSQVEIYCYYNNKKHDSHTERISTYADHWLDCAWMGNEALANRIRADGIDILIDLSGHTASNCLPAFARKPAPIQATWIGYAGTTGLTAMDYRITDARKDPPGLTERYHTEKLVRLPNTGTAYQPEPGCPPVNPLPALTTGGIMFASLNNPIKINPSVAALWARLLTAIPNSRLMLGNISGEKVRQQMTELFGNAGIPSERLVLQPRMPILDYLKLHHQIDLALDTFPYNGGTTSLHSLWMGVPVLTLAGEHTVSRVGVNMMTRVGLTEFITHCEEEYLERAIQFTQDLSGLSRIRLSLRERMSGDNCDPAVITRNLEAAYREMWRKWCTA